MNSRQSASLSKSGSNIAYKCAEFGYAKLARIDVVGDAPTQRIENRMVFTLSIDPNRPPAGLTQRPSTTNGNGKYDAEDAVIIEPDDDE